MPKLAIARDLLDDYRRLEAHVRKRVDEVFGKFDAGAAHPGLNFEKLEGALDPRVRTIRLGENHRGIVFAPERGGTCVLVRVLPHDEAYRWTRRHRFRVNGVTGALEVENVPVVERTIKALDAAAGPAGNGQRLFAGRHDKDFTRLGLPESLIPLLRRLTDESELEALASVLPERQGDALHMLAAGYSVEEAWAELVADQDPGQVDPEDVTASLERPASQSRFFTADAPDELLEVLAHPFDAWRVFLHPAQRRLAYRERHRPPYPGPVLVTGGAGTGKTVVAVHRARALAEQLPGDRPEERVLFTTFTRDLAAAIRRQLRLLGGPELLSRVDVLNVDRLAFQVVRDAEGARPLLATDEEQRKLWKRVADELGVDFHPVFLQQEWEQVVLAQEVASLHAYLRVPRPGRGVRLDRRQRVEVWKAVEAFTNHLARQGRRTHLQLADAAAGFLAARTVKPYRHAVVDEAQDLHAAQWRMLRAAVAGGENDLFIVGDTHQRIYDHRLSLRSVGVEVTGRSRRLHLNYRTTQEILRWALRLLHGEAFDELDGTAATLGGYRSQLHGPPPTVQGFATFGEELDALAQAVRGWLDQGVEPAAIGVAARTHETAQMVRERLEAAGVGARLLSGGGEEGARGGAVEVGTMHRMKGLEYRCVAVVHASEGQVPHPSAVTAEQVDPVAHRHDLQRERCLLYVACTRARDELRVTWNGRPSAFLTPLL